MTALDLYRHGELAKAEEILRFLIEQDFEPASNRLHIARLCLLNDRDGEAEEQVAQAWELRATAPAYTVPRALWFQLLFALLAGKNPGPLAGKIKTALQTEDAFGEWTMEPVLVHLKQRLAPEAHAWLSTLVAVFADKTKLRELDGFPVWRDQPPLPLEG